MGDYTTLSNDIKRRDFKHIYLLYGEEDYLKNMRKKELLSYLANPEDTMNYAFYEGSGIDLIELSSLVSTMPFFADHRTILVENSGLFYSAKDGDEDALEENEEESEKKNNVFIKLLENVPDTTYLIFVEQKVKRNIKTYKTLVKYGDDIEFQRQEGPAIKSWIMGKLKQEGYSITEKAFQLLWEKVGDDRTGVDKNKKKKTGNDMFTISCELEKLLSYCADTKTIREEDVEQIVTKRLEEQGFIMTSAMATKNRKGAMDKYYELLALRSEPLAILGTIRWQFDTLLQIKDLQQRGLSEGEIATKLKMHPFAVSNNGNLCKYFTFGEIKDMVNACVETENDIKTGRMDARLAIEVLIIQCVSR